MAYPAIDDRDYSYTAFQTGQGDNSFPGTYLDNDLDELWTGFNALASFVQVAHASDGALKLASVERRHLSPSLTLGVPAPTVWVTATAYEADDTVTTNNRLYICLVDHTSGTFATDLAAAKWAEMAYFAPVGTVDDGAITTAKLDNSAVTTAKLDDEAVTTAKIDDGAVTRAKAATNLGVFPVGGETDFAGITAPAGWMLCYGQAINRVTYSDLFSAITATATASTTNTSATLSSVSTNFVGLGLEGAFVEGAGITAGTTIVSLTSNTITLSNPATATATGVTIRLLPHGRGDGSTTFNVPDRRGRVTAGRDNMGGSAASRLTSTTVDATKLGSAGGAQTHALTSGEGPTHTHTVTDAGHTHAVTDAGHNHDVSVSAAASVAPGANTVVAPGTPGSSPISSSTDTTGLTVNSATTGISLGNSGSGTAHNNVQPTGVTNKIIFAGV
jgi:microcystin-dependent protein